MSKPSFAVLVIFIGLSLLPCFSAGEEVLGPVSREAILEKIPAWIDLVAAYQPAPEAVDKLRGLGREVAIEVYFGSWCSDSEAHVSAFFKVLDLADTPLVRAEFFGVPEAKDLRESYERGRKIDKLPTFVVMVDGREAGRIVETPQKSVEEDLVRILGI